MLATFSTSVAGWQGFYTLAGSASATILAGTTAYLDYIVGVVAVGLTSAANESWDLMLNLATAKAKIAAAKPAAGEQ